MNSSTWRNNWKQLSFNDESGQLNIEDWICPYCDKGFLSPVTNSLIQWRSDDSFMHCEELKSLAIGFEHEIDADPTTIWGKFTLCLECMRCQNRTVCSGTYKNDLGYEYVGGGLGEREFSYSCYCPTFIDPGLKIIKIPSCTPVDVQEILKTSFSLFFFDPPSCANRIRVALESMMDSMKVKKYPRRGKRKKISLHCRLENFGRMKNCKYLEESEKLMAVKWLGNEGSHSKISKDDVLDAFELFEFVLERIYVRKEERLSAITKEINTRRQPRKR